AFARFRRGARSPPRGSTRPRRSCCARARRRWRGSGRRPRASSDDALVLHVQRVPCSYLRAGARPASGRARVGRSRVIVPGLGSYPSAREVNTSSALHLVTILAISAVGPALAVRRHAETPVVCPRRRGGPLIIGTQNEEIARPEVARRLGLHARVERPHHAP